MTDLERIALENDIMDELNAVRGGIYHKHSELSLRECYEIFNEVALKFVEGREFI